MFIVVLLKWLFGVKKELLKKVEFCYRLFWVDFGVDWCGVMGCLVLEVGVVCGLWVLL